MAPVEADSLCDLCGKAADPEAEECVGVTCVARCHHPKGQDVYHTDCLKKYLRSFSRHQDISRYSGFVCPRGKGRGTSAKQPCTSKVSHSQKIIIRSKKSTAVVPDAAAANAPDTIAANNKARNGKKKGADAGPAATATAPAPKPTKPKLPTLNSLPRRFASEPYLPTEYVQLPPAPELVRKDPLGRNTAAAAAASAKATKKNAKRALARQRKQEEQEQQTGQQSGSAAAAAAHTALGDGWTAARGTGAAATAAARAAAAADAEQEEWEEWEGNEHTDTDAQYAAHGDLHDVLYAGGFGAQFVAEGSWQDSPHRQESDASAHTFAAFVPADEASDSPTHGSAATGMGASGVSSTEPLPGPTAHKEPAALAPSAGVAAAAAAAVTTMHPAPFAAMATSAAGTAMTPLSSAVTDTTLCHNYSQHQQAPTSAAGAGAAAAAASSGLYQSASARTYPTAQQQQQQQPQSVHTTTSSTTAVPSHTTPMQNTSWMRQQLLQANYSSAPAAASAAAPTAMQTAAGTAQQLLQANYSSAPAVAAASMAMQIATVPSAIPTSGFFPFVAARGGPGALTAASSFTSLQQQHQQQYKMSAISAPPVGYSTGYSAPAPMHSAGHYGTATAAAPAGSVQWTQQYYQGLGATALAATTGYSGGIYAAAPTAAAVGSGADADGEETLDDLLKLLGV